MDNQHKLMKGYWDLSAEEIALMNEIKAKGAELGSLVERLEKAQKDECENLQHHTEAEDFTQRVESLNDARRWTAIGKTQLQQGLMGIIRAVARPTSF